MSSELDTIIQFVQRPHSTVKLEKHQHFQLRVQQNRHGRPLRRFQPKTRRRPRRCPVPHSTPPPSTPSRFPPCLLPAAAAVVKPQSTCPTKLPLRPSSSSSSLRRLYLPPRCAAASTGYAAALLDAACCDGVLDAVERDARRLLRGLRAIPALGESAKGKVVRRVSEGGGFYRNLVVLVRMLVAKGKTRLVEEVMEEIGRICDEIREARVAVMRTKAKMELERLQEIAGEV
ncbi:uncharacterized protein LOC141837464 [Curcuma longa]|uniref:uncharacterized protein LOC141837464 n=1 Tax=Curcuma longa TaxID=136217 RepID=UPI003D9DDBA4